MLDAERVDECSRRARETEFLIRKALDGHLFGEDAKRIAREGRV